MVITRRGNYAGTRTVEFKVARINVEKTNLTGIKNVAALRDLLEISRKLPKNPSSAQFSAFQEAFGRLGQD